MIKKIIAVIFCLIITSVYNSAKADATFTWFGFKKDNTEIVFSSNPEHECHTHKCHHKKPKPKHKHKPKHEPPKKSPKHHMCLWWCK